MTDAPAPSDAPIAMSSESTVVAEFTPDTITSEAYRSEVALETAFIEALTDQA